jgi:predicted DNA binding CopG/RHH family protein
MKNYYDEEEREIIQSFEKGGWVSNKSKIPKIQRLAKENLKKSKRINIRLTIKDLEDVKKLASLEGIPYQTFVSSIIHKYANGQIKPIH